MKFNALWSQAVCRIRHLVPLVLLLLLCSCTKTVTKAGLDAEARKHLHGSFIDKTYYVGSKDGHDYFIIRRGLAGSPDTYRVLESEGAVSNRFSITKDETRWVGYGLTGVNPTNSLITFSNALITVPK